LALLVSMVLLVGVISLPWLSSIFEFVSLKPLEYLICILLASSVLWAGEAYKYFLVKKAFYEKRSEPLGMKVKPI